MRVRRLLTLLLDRFHAALARMGEDNLALAPKQLFESGAEEVESVISVCDESLFLRQFHLHLVAVALPL